MFEKFEEWQKRRHDYAKNWKEKTGGKVMGYFCTYVPEEILVAAGILPVRILGSHEPQDVTEPHIFAMYCPFCRDCLAQGLQGKYDYLDGIMIAQSCLHIRQAYTSWEKHIPTEFNYYLPMPNRVQSKRALPYLASEIGAFKKAIEKWVGKEITDSSIREATNILNTNRDLMWQLYNFRKEDDPKVTGEEAMNVVMSDQMIDKAEHNKELERVLKLLPDRKLDRETGSRLMIIGSEDDDINFIHMVESVGATIVTDDHCTGSRYFWNNVETNGDLLASIAARYIDRPPCPSKDWEQRKREEHVVKLGKDFNVAGAIVMQQKFCDPHELDTPALIKVLNKNGIQTLFLEFDVTVPIGQFRIRCEAFLEMLSEEDLF